MLELRAAFNALRAFTRDSRELSVHLCMDNATALVYIKKQAGRDRPNCAVQPKRSSHLRNARLTSPAKTTLLRIACILLLLLHVTDPGQQRLETRDSSIQRHRDAMGSRLRLIRERLESPTQKIRFVGSLSQPLRQITTFLLTGLPADHTSLHPSA